MNDLGDLHYLDITAAAAGVRDGSLSPVRLTEAVLERIDALESRLHVFVTLLAVEALEAAKAAEKTIKQGNHSGPCMAFHWE